MRRAVGVAPQVVVAVKKQVLLAALAGGSAVAGQRLARRYRLDRDAAYARLAAVARTTVVTRFGTVEYAEHGSDEPLLAVHGFSAAAMRRCFPCAGWLLTAGSSPRHGSATWARACSRAPPWQARLTRSPRCSTVSGLAGWTWPRSHLGPPQPSSSPRGTRTGSSTSP